MLSNLHSQEEVSRLNEVELENTDWKINGLLFKMKTGIQ